MNPLIPKKRNTSFKGDVLRLVSGTGLAQIIGLLAAPVLTRLYAPEAFGVAALFTSLTGILGVLACMRYELSIVLPDNDREAANLLAVSLAFSFSITAITILIIWFCGSQILQWTRMTELAPYLWLVPIMVLISGIVMTLNYWNTRTKNFTRLSISRVTSALANTTGSLSMGLAGHATGGSLISASIGGQAVMTAVLGGLIWRDDRRFLVSSITWQEMKAGMHRYRRLPFFSTWAALINTASWQLPILMLGAFFSPAIVGFYALGFRILQMPMSLIGGAISQAFLHRAADAKRNNTIDKLILNLFEKLLLAGFVPLLALSIIGEDLYIYAFGENWAEAGVYTQILSVWALLWFISSPLSAVVLIFEEHKKEIILSSLSFTTRVLAIVIGGLMNSPRLAISLFAISGVISYSYLLWTIFRLANVELIELKKIIWQVIKKSIWPLVLLMGIKFINIGTFSILIIFTLILIVYLILNKNSFIEKQ